MKTVRTILLFFSLLILTGNSLLLAAQNADQLYRKARPDFYRLYRDSEFRKYEHRWLNTIKKFETIYQKYPNHKLAVHSLFNAGKLYRSLYKWNHKAKYLGKSISAFKKLSEQYPNENLADDALFLLAENYHLFQKNNNLAYYSYQKIVKNYSSGDWKNKALSRLKTLKKPAKASYLSVKNKKEAKEIKPDTLLKAKYGGISFKASSSQRSVLVNRIDYWTQADYSRMVINTKKPIRYKYQSLGVDRKNHTSKKIYFDLKKSFITSSFKLFVNEQKVNSKKRINANDGLVKQVRIAQFDKKTVRIVLDLASLKNIKVFDFKLPNQNKIIIDMFGNKPSPALELKEPEKLDRPSYKLANKEKRKTSSRSVKIKKSVRRGKYQAKNNKISLSEALGLKVRTVIIDPGHGGKDPGAVALGVKEKNLTLKMGLALREVIRKKAPHIKVLMTRTTDKYLTLEARTAFANQNNGDLFISIHINAHNNRRPNGIETYFLNLTTDDNSLRQAARENEASIKSISDLQTILDDIVTSSKIQESSDLAEVIQASMVRNIRKTGKIRVKDMGVKQAPFFVLIGAEMPSILIEAGFITNRTENRRLKSRKYRNLLANGIYNGIGKYMRRGVVAK